MRKVMLAIGCVVGIFTGVSAANASEPVASQAVTRAQVLADLEMWDRAGMNQYPSEAGYTDVRNDAGYQRNLSEYQRLRSGPEYQEAVHKLEATLGKQ